MFIILSILSFIGSLFQFIRVGYEVTHNSFNYYSLMFLITLLVLGIVFIKLSSMDKHIKKLEQDIYYDENENK